MRIAAISDIHGNLWALEAVLADIARRDGLQLLGQDIHMGAQRAVEAFYQLGARHVAVLLPALRQQVVVEHIEHDAAVAPARSFK